MSRGLWPSYRVAKGAPHQLAAELEPSTSARERWCVNTEDLIESGHVYLEVADATLRRLVG